MHVDSKVLDDLSKLLGGALGAASGMKGEVEGQIRRHLERVMMDLDLVSREEFEAMSVLAKKAMERQEKLEKDLVEMKAELEAFKKTH